MSFKNQVVAICIGLASGMPSAFAANDGQGFNLSGRWIVVENRSQYVNQKADFEGAVLFSNPAKDSSESITGSGKPDNDSMVVGCIDEGQQLYILPLYSGDKTNTHKENIIVQIDSKTPILIKYDDRNYATPFSRIPEIRLPDQNAAKNAIKEMLLGERVIANYRFPDRGISSGQIGTIESDLTGFRVAFMRSCPKAYANMTVMDSSQIDSFVGAMQALPDSTFEPGASHSKASSGDSSNSSQGF